MVFPTQWHAVSANNIFLMPHIVKNSPLWTIDNEAALVEASKYHTMVQQDKHYPIVVADGIAYHSKTEGTVNPRNEAVREHHVSMFNLKQVEIPLTSIK